MMDFFERHAAKIVPISESGCWIWIGASTKSGYGMAWTGKKSQSGYNLSNGAHRLAFEARHGAIPDGLSVCHRCDVRPCVNPDHLFLGTQQDNLRDMRAKGRQVSGSRHGMATMDENLVRTLRRQYRPYVVTYADLARRYGLTKCAVSAAVNRRTWSHVE